MFEGFRKDFPQRRPVILMRSGFVGSQRYSMIPWSGDVRPLLAPAPTETAGRDCAQYGHAGPRLYALRPWRFCGRLHAAPNCTPAGYSLARSSPSSAPTPRRTCRRNRFFGMTAPEYARRYIQLRYSLLPYNYTFWENSTTGLPMMRPLSYVDNDPTLLTNTTTYLWGNDFLSPVVEKGATSQTIHFPKELPGWTTGRGRSYTGGQTARMPVTIWTYRFLCGRARSCPCRPSRSSGTNNYNHGRRGTLLPPPRRYGGSGYAVRGRRHHALEMHLRQISTGRYSLPLRLPSELHHPRAVWVRLCPANPGCVRSEYVIHGLTAPVKSVKLLSKDGKERPIPVTWKPGDAPLEVYFQEGERLGVVVRMIKLDSPFHPRSTRH